MSMDPPITRHQNSILPPRPKPNQRPRSKDSTAHGEPGSHSAQETDPHSGYRAQGPPQRAAPGRGDRSAGHTGGNTQPIVTAGPFRGSPVRNADAERPGRVPSTCPDPPENLADPSPEFARTLDRLGWLFHLLREAFIAVFGSHASLVEKINIGEN
ncbi:hypothetical protein GCM10010278_77820 [Streptomyces melanogenes]|nr:hypothetical protein GCM10010278_77820 [Streptomyces melanogenes]